MMTFLPYASFEASAMVLDDQRLGKQRLEARQLLGALLGFSEGWKEHPATAMWRGHEWWLAEYGRVVCAEWRGRGFKDEMLAEFEGHVATLVKGPEPGWLGNELLHSSHRANLVRKDSKRYKGFYGFTEEPMNGYVWPDA